MVIDINCDVGEGIGNERLILPYISSCNIACGAHAGDIATINEVISLAIENKVKIGAHPSFPDRENFGRKVLNITHKELQISLEEQITLMQERVQLQHTKLYHIKPHGALYNLAVVDREVARVIVKVVLQVDKSLFLYVPFNSIIAKEALYAGLSVKYEAFADRNYNADLTLVSRNLPNALLESPEDVFKHVITMLEEQKVKTITNEMISIKADTFCIHGDTDNAAYVVQYLYKGLTEKGIKIV